MTRIEVFTIIFDMEDNSGLRELVRVMLGYHLEAHGYTCNQVREFYLLKPISRERGSHIVYRTRHARFMKTSQAYNIIYSEIQHALEAFAKGKLIKKFARKDYQRVSLAEIGEQSELITNSKPVQKLLDISKKSARGASSPPDVVGESLG